MIKRLMKKVIVLNILLHAFFNAVAQPSSLDSLQKKFDAYRKQALYEKIYAHTDRNLYFTGEHIWYKIYAVDGSFHKPLDLSKVAYVELLDSENKPVLQAKIELTGGAGNGSFLLPVSLASGLYTFRSYTNWMKNFGVDFFLHKKITIINPFVKAEGVKIKNDRQANGSAVKIAFFPEGGNLVTGLKSKVAFKLTDRFGKGINGVVSIITKNNDTITVFRPLKFGIGNFYFKPETNEQYRAVVKHERGAISTHAFPESKPAGYAMELKDSAENIMVYVYRQKTEDANTPLYLFVHTRQIIVKAEAKFFKHHYVAYSLDKKTLPEGISHFTIFNSALQPICERLYFKIPASSKLHIEANVDRSSYNTRQKVRLQLQTYVNAQRTPTSSNLSIAIYKLDSLTEETTQNIFHQFWLSSDIKGRIESPEYYFNPKNPDVYLAADNLMLTQGWRRFNWSNVLLDNQTFNYVPEHRGHIIRARVNHPMDSSAAGILTYLSSPGSTIRLYGSKSNIQKETRYELKGFYGHRKIILQPAPKHNSYEIEILNPFSATYTTEESGPAELLPNSHREFILRSIAMQVQDIFYYDTTVNRPIKAPADSLPFYGKANKIYYLDNFTRFPVMEEVMREYVSEVFVRKRKDKFHFVMINSSTGTSFNGEPLVLVDGLPIFDMNKVMALDPLTIKTLEVLNRKYYHGASTFHGILSYTTYSHDLSGFELEPSSVSVDYEGLQLKREFYSPLYETTNERNNTMPDQRYLLFWKPDISTDTNGHHKLEFYTSDVAGTFIVVIEGITKDGHAGSQIQTFSVKQSLD